MGITRTVLNGRNQNGAREPGQFEEVGTAGLPLFSGFITKAYNNQLYWPQVEPVYSRIWRSDAEVTIMRSAFEAWASSLTVTMELPEQKGGVELGDPTDDDERAREFGYQVLDDLEGGIGQWVTSVITRAPFYGWGLWEAPLGLRRPNWKPPNPGDEWRSEYDDGLVGFRRLAFRDYSSFEKWESDDESGRTVGMWQNDPPNSRELIPFDRALHVTYGDADNPEGLATLEAIWRLERIKYGLEVVMGIGFEHAAGYLDVKASIKPSPDDKALVRQAARAIMTAQEGNFALWPENFTGEVKDTNFQAATALLEAIRYYSILKLSLLGMQWIAQSGISTTGTYGAQMDGSSMALLLFNSMVGGFEQQANDQIIKRLYTHPTNAAAFPNATRRPYLRIGRLDKTVQLDQLSTFVTAMNAIMPLGDEDFIAIRRKSELLPEALPQPEEAGSAVSTGTPGATVDGIQKITDSLRAGTMPEAVAIETLVFIGVSRTVAEKMVADILDSPEPEPEDTAVPDLEPDETAPDDDMTPEDTAVAEDVEEEDADMSDRDWSQRWWELRAQIYRKPLGNDALVQLVDMLDNATTAADLEAVSEAMNGH